MSQQRRSARILAAALVVLALAPAAFAAGHGDATDVTSQFRGVALGVDRLQVFDVAGVLIIRGRTADPAQAEAVGVYASILGYGRVANLIQIVTHDDAALTRTAERELSMNRSLDGCRFTVHSLRGVVRIAGSVRHELQKDVAVQVLRSIDGVRRVELDLQRF